MKFENYFKKKNGFTLVELILASSISLSTILVGYYVLRNIIEGNKIDEIQFGLNAQLNDAIDFIIDEVESGERIIDNESDITSFNNACSYPEGETFIFGIRLPNQALVKSGYKQEGDEYNLSQIDCPIVYSLKQIISDQNESYSLQRYGPQFNEKGFYLSPSFNEFQTSTILENISSKDNYKKIKCSKSWKSLKTFSGLSYCIDSFNKAIEIQIKLEDNKNKIANNPQTALISSGGFSRVQDESQISLIPSPSSNGGDPPNCIGGNCCWLGICLKSKKVTFVIDYSIAMDEDFEHRNGEIINGSWVQSSPEFIKPRINGKSLLSYAISSLKDHLSRLPISESDPIYFQIWAYDSSTSGKYPEGNPRESNLIKLSNSSRLAAFEFLDNLEDRKVIKSNPWEALCTVLTDDLTEQMIIASSTIPIDISRDSEYISSCWGKSYYSIEDWAKIVEEYNRDVRSFNAAGPLITDSVSYFHNFCESNKNYLNNNWMGILSSGSESQCNHIK